MVAGSLGAQADRRLPFVRRFTTQGLTVFVFHEITDTPSEFQRKTAGYTSRAVFEEQIRWIGERFEFIAPTALPQLGGSGAIPSSAALVSFDDAWAGVFHAGLPILASLGVPSVCFVNMATVNGDPDLSAVRHYERERSGDGRSRLDFGLDPAAADSFVTEVRSRYQDDQEFATFQGPTATPDDLATAVDGEQAVWFGSHLFHHWDTSLVTSEVFTTSAQENAQALAGFANTLPALATPYGYGDEQLYRDARELGYRVMFIATGAQNHDPTGFVLDRLTLEPEPSGPQAWWYSAHRRRLFGPLAN